MRFQPAAELTPQAIAAICEQVRVRVLRWFARSDLIDSDDVREMLTWENSGFSLDAEVRIAAQGPRDPERLLRYCARPPFALERLDRIDEQRVIYRLPRPQRDGTTALSLTPLALIDHLAAVIPPPKLHRHRYHGVAPNSPLRAAATAYGREPPAEVASPPATPAPSVRSPARYLWAMLLARLFEALPRTCPNCGTDMRIIAFVTDAAPIKPTVGRLDELPQAF